MAIAPRRDADTIGAQAFLGVESPHVRLDAGALHGYPFGRHWDPWGVGEQLVHGNDLSRKQFVRPNAGAIGPICLGGQEGVGHLHDARHGAHAAPEARESHALSRRGTCYRAGRLPPAPSRRGDLPIAADRLVTLSVPGCSGAPAAGRERLRNAGIAGCACAGGGGSRSHS